MKALITGASGFIGSTLIEQLSAQGFEVHALMRKSSSTANLEGLPYKRVDGDLSNLDSLKKAVQGVDYVYHLAGVTAAPNREGYFEHNANGTARLAQAVAEANPGLARFVHVSSLAAAGPALAAQPRLEHETECPVSFYGQSKLAGEREVLKYKDTFPISIVRPPMVYGPKDKGVYVVIQTVARNMAPVLPGSSAAGVKYYSAIHVADLCRGIIQAGIHTHAEARSGEIYYLAGDGMHSYQELLSTIARCLNKNPIRFRIPKLALMAAAAGFSAAGYFSKKTFPLNWDKLNEILPDYWICSNAKAKRMLNFTPEFDLTRGMAETIEWYKRQKWL